MPPIAVPVRLRVQDGDAAVHNAVIVAAVREAVGSIVVVQPEVDVAVHEADRVVDVALQPARRVRGPALGEARHRHRWSDPRRHTPAQREPATRRERK